MSNLSFRQKTIGWILGMVLTLSVCHAQNKKIQEMYLRTHKSLSRAGVLCMIHKKEALSFQRAVHYQIIAMEVYTGRISIGHPRMPRHKWVAVLTMMAREMGKGVTKANYGESMVHVTIDKHFEKAALEGINEPLVEREIEKLRRTLRLPSLHEIFKDPHFALGDIRQIEEKLNSISR